MASTMDDRNKGSASMAAGFLFGNIDESGRLEEAEYLDEDAKEHLDYVAPAVTGTVEELEEATRRTKENTGVDDDYDDDDDNNNEAQPKPVATTSNAQATPHLQSAKDYADEKEFVDEDLDENERDALVRVALFDGGASLQKDPKLSSIDEDYDDDDDDEPSETTKPAPTPTQEPTQSEPTKRVNIALPSIGPSGLESTAAPAVDAQILPTRHELGGAIDEIPCFSRLFTPHLKKLPKRPKRARFGWVDPSAESVHDATAIAALAETDKKKKKDKIKAAKKAGQDGGANQGPLDEIELINTDLSLVKPDYVKEFFHSALNEERLLENGNTIDNMEISPKTGDKMDSAEKGKEIFEWVLPPQAVAVEPESDYVHSMVHQHNWEDEVLWGDCTDDSDSDEADSPLQTISESQVTKPLSDAEKPKGKPFGKGKKKDDDDSDQEDDDDIMWESVEKPSAPKEKDSHGKKREGKSRRPSEPTSAIQKQKSKDVPKPGKPFGKKSETDAPPASAPLPLTYRVIGQNQDLEAGEWVDEILWDSDTSQAHRQKAHNHPDMNGHGSSWYNGSAQDLSPVTVLPVVNGSRSTFAVDMNDPNLVLDFLRQDPYSKKASDYLNLNEQMLYELEKRLHDRLNISNDIYYQAASQAPGTKKTGRRSALRGLTHSTPALKCMTSIGPVPTDEQLIFFHRPFLSLSGETLPFTSIVTPVRRKRLPSDTALPITEGGTGDDGVDAIAKGGGAVSVVGSGASALKKKSDLSCGARDPFHVVLVEYALERNPPIMMMPGMASRLITYVRKRSAQAAADAATDAIGTADADTVFLGPDDMPPLNCGDVKYSNLLPGANGPPHHHPATHHRTAGGVGDGVSSYLSPSPQQGIQTIECSLFASAAATMTTATTDFLVIRKSNTMYIREIDSLVSVGVTEPKVEVMVPNTERYKKYIKDRVLLWILRQFQAQKKKGVLIPALKKNQVFQTFWRKRTFPDTFLLKALKELTVFEGGLYQMNEPPQGLTMLEVELLRSVTPEETCAWESMESGLENLHKKGIHIFTHPTSQGNILQAAERTGLAAGKVVGEFLRQNLLKTPWYRTAQMVNAQKALKKDLLAAITLVRTAYELCSSPRTADSRVAQLTHAEMAMLLSGFFRVSTKRMPSNPETRRRMLMDAVNKKSIAFANAKANGNLSGGFDRDFTLAIEAVITKHVTASETGTDKDKDKDKEKDKEKDKDKDKDQAGAGGVTANVAPPVAFIPLIKQRKALELGDVSALPMEEDKHAMDAHALAAAVAQSAPKSAFGNAFASGLKTSPSQLRLNQATPNAAGGAEEETGADQQSPSSPVTKPTAPAKPALNKKIVRRKESSVDEKEDAAELGRLVEAQKKAGEQKAELEKSKAAKEKESKDGPESAIKKKKPKYRSIKVTKWETDESGNRVRKVTRITDRKEIEKYLAKEKMQKAKKAAMETRGEGGDATTAGAGGEADGAAAGPSLKISIGLNALTKGRKSGGGGGTLSRRASVRDGPSARVKGEPSSATPNQASVTTPRPDGSDQPPETAVGRVKLGRIGSGIGKIIIDTKNLGDAVKQKEETNNLKRRRSSYNVEDLETPRKRPSGSANKSVSSRKRRNGDVALNILLEQVEKAVRDARGYIFSTSPMVIKRIRSGESPPPTVIPQNLARPKNTGLDFTNPVNTKLVPLYGELVKEQMYLNLIRSKCKQLKYQSVNQFLDDMKLLVHNAEAFNTGESEQWVVQHARLLLDTAEEKIGELRSEITEAEEDFKKQIKEGGESRAVGAVDADGHQDANSPGEGSIDTAAREHEGFGLADLTGGGDTALASPIASPLASPLRPDVTYDKANEFGDDMIDEIAMEIAADTAEAGEAVGPSNTAPNATSLADNEQGLSGDNIPLVVEEP